jgi:hypothetical protein
MPLILGANSVSGYTVKNSLRFNSGSSDYLNKTLPSPRGGVYKWTYSFWVKRSILGVDQAVTGAYFSGTFQGRILFRSDDQFEVFDYRSSSFILQKKTNRKFRDTSAWYHIVISNDNSVASPETEIYVNGVKETSFATNNEYSQNETNSFNNDYANYIGQFGAGDYFNGYISEFYFIDGQALTPTSFGETDTLTGIWKPKAYTGTYGTNGFYLQFKNSASLGTDSSGNGNTWTVNNLTSIDQTTDTPTNNFATWNPLNAYNSTTAGTLSEGNLKNSGTATDGGIPSTIGVSAGKWYWEVKYTTQVGGDPVLGIISSSGASKMQNANSGSVTSGSGVWCMFNLTSGGVGFQENGVFVSYPSSTLANGDILNIALDVDARKLWFGKNGTWYSSGNPATGANAISTNLTASETWFAYCEKRNGSSVWETNFGNPTYSASSYTDGAGFGNFSYAVPSGYYSLNTKNLATFG